MAIAVAAWRPTWRVPAATAAIFTKGLFLALVLTDPAVRPLFPVLPLAFDIAAIIVLALIIATAVRTTPQTRVRPVPTRARAGDHEGLDGDEHGAARARRGCPRPGVLRPRAAGRDRRVAIRSDGLSAQGSNR